MKCVLPHSLLFHNKHHLIICFQHKVGSLRKQSWLFYIYLFFYLITPETDLQGSFSWKYEMNKPLFFANICVRQPGLSKRHRQFVLFSIHIHRRLHEHKLTICLNIVVMTFFIVTSQGTAKVSKIHLVWSMNICSRFNWNPSYSWKNISLKTKKYYLHEVTGVIDH